MASKGGIVGAVRDNAAGAADTARGVGEKAGGGILGDVKDLVDGNPAAQRLREEASHFVQAGGRHLMSGLTDKVSGIAKHLDDYAESGGASPLLKGAEKMAEGKSAPTAAVSAGLSSVKDKVAGKVKDVFGANDEGKNVNVVSIIEEIDVGAPRSVVYNQWTQFAEFSTFTQGVRNADQEDPAHVTWRTKIFLSTRTWDSQITEQIPDRRIAWKSSGDKGTVDGTVTFHELTPDLTKVILQLEYKPQGLFERTANLWRAQGRRARLDLKHFRRFVMMHGAETGAWRGEIRDGEVVRETDQEPSGDPQARDPDRHDEQPGRRRPPADADTDDRRTRSRPRSTSGNGDRAHRPRERSGGRGRDRERDADERPTDRERDDDRERRHTDRERETRRPRGTGGEGSKDGDDERAHRRALRRRDESPRPVRRRAAQQPRGGME